MELVFIDEQYGQDERGKYTAALAAIFHEDIINRYRIEFVHEYVKILNLETSDENGKIINLSLPELHGSDMLPGYSYEQKIAVFKLVCRLVKKYKIKILRIGYYDQSLFPAIRKNSAEIVSFCISNLDLVLNKFFSENYLFIYELDKNNLDNTNRPEV